MFKTFLAASTAMTLALAGPAHQGQLFNVGLGQSTTLLQLFEHLRRLARAPAELRPRHGAPRAGDVPLINGGCAVQIVLWIIVVLALLVLGLRINTTLAMQSISLPWLSFFFS